MNDCFWNWIQVCENTGCRCIKYLSVNSTKGYEASQEYNEKVSTAVKEIQEQYKEKFEKYKEVE